jgi:predicted metal-dependent phosphotriesterase family hydrolase
MNNLIPALLKDGFSKAELDQILIENPKKAFQIKVRRISP